MSDEKVGRTDGFVPPHLDVQMRRVHQHMANATAYAADAAGRSTTEEIKKVIGLAFTELMDASFWCAHIERDLIYQPLDGLDVV